MKKTVIQYLQWSNPKSIANSAEESFFYHHASEFNQKTNIYNNTTDVYGIITACIILQGSINKEKLDYFVLNFPKEALSMECVVRNATAKLPFMKSGEDKIFVPTLDPTLNRLYDKNLAGLLEPEYHDVLKKPLDFYVDPFETYGVHLFRSGFTRLVELESKDKETFCFYHPYLETILILDSEGRKIEEIPIFDEKLKHPNKENLFNRLDKVMDSYFTGNREEFLEALKTNGLISFALYQEIRTFLESRTIHK